MAPDLPAEVRALQAEIGKLRECVGEIDGELLALAVHVDDEVASQIRTLIGAVGLAFVTLWADDRLQDQHTVAGSLYQALYPATYSSQSLRHRWVIPKRRWRQFGSLAQLREVAEEKGVELRSTATRETIVRDLVRQGVTLRAQR